MKQKKILGTELTVSEVCFGTAGFGSRVDRETAFLMLDRFADCGGSFIDTANVYSRDFEAGFSASERIIGEYLKSRGKHTFTVATKGAHPIPKTMHISRLSREEIEHDLDESLTSLGLDTIDYYWLHRDDRSKPIGEIIEIMEGFVKSGKIRYYGASNYSTERILDAAAYAEAHGFKGFSAVSNRWMPAVENEGHPLSEDTTLVRFTDDELSLFDRLNMTFIPYSATAKGWFSKAAAGVASERLDPVFENETNRALLAKLICEDCSVQTALLRHIISYPQTIIPITTASKLSQMDDICAV